MAVVLVLLIALVLLGAYSQRPARWEYRIERYADSEDLAKKLAPAWGGGLGDDGWELVGTVMAGDRRDAILKHRK